MICDDWNSLNFQKPFTDPKTGISFTTTTWTDFRARIGRYNGGAVLTILNQFTEFIDEYFRVNAEAC